MRQLFNFILLLFSISFASHAMESKVYPVGTDYFNDMAFSGSAQSQQKIFTIKIIPTSFRVNQRPVFNPISGVGSIAFQIGIAGVAFEASFPAWVAKNLNGTVPGNDDAAVIDVTLPPRVYSGATIASAYASRNLVLVRAQEEPSITVIDALGNYLSMDRINQINYIVFRYDQTQGANCPLPPAPQPAWCSQHATNSPSHHPQQHLALQTARFLSRPLLAFFSQLSFAGGPPPPGFPGADAQWNQPDFDAANWGNPAPYDPRYTSQDGPISAMPTVHYSSDLKQLEIRVAFPTYDTNAGSYF